MWDLNTTGVATSVGRDQVTFLAGFDSEQDGQAALAAVAGSPLVLASPAPLLEPVDPEGWYQPEAQSDIEIPTTPPVNLKLTVGPAFGHGHHPTTAIALDLMSRWLRGGQRVLDFGAGTGILGLAALAMGAERVTAIEIDPAAIGIAKLNLGANRPVVGSRTMTFHTEIDDAVRVGRPYELVVANVLVGVHRANAQPIIALLDPAGVTPPCPQTARTVIVAGILNHQLAEVVEAYAPLKMVDSIEIDDWVGAVLQ